MKVVGPDQSDIEKFNESKFGWCPNCFKEIYDDSIRCCYCNEFVEEKVLNAHPEISNFNRRGRYLLAFLILIGFLWSVIGPVLEFLRVYFAGS